MANNQIGEHSANTRFIKSTHSSRKHGHNRTSYKHVLGKRIRDKYQRKRAKHGIYTHFGQQTSKRGCNYRRRRMVRRGQPKIQSKDSRLNTKSDEEQKGGDTYELFFLDLSYLLGKVRHVEGPCQPIETSNGR